MLAAPVVFFAFALGGIIHTASGFGSALVAMPIVCLVIDLRMAAPLQALLSFVVSATVLYQNWRALQWREASRLILGAILGIPLGTLALKSVAPSLVTGCLGLMLLGYGLFEFRTRHRARSSSDSERAPGPDDPKSKIQNPKSGASWIAWLVGFAAGVVGGAYAADGPPLIIYGSVKRWPKATFKSVLQSCFLVNGAFIVLCHGASGLITKSVLSYCLYALPGLLIGIVVGSYVDRRLDHNRFRTFVLCLILLLGASLLGRAVFG